MSKPKKPGRPPAIENNKRQFRITIRLTGDELMKINKRADAANKTHSTFIRETLLSRDTSTAKTSLLALEELKKMSNQLEKIYETIRSKPGFGASAVDAVKLLNDIDLELKDIKRNILTK